MKRVIALPEGFDRRGVYYTYLVRVVAPHFVAGFETDGIVRNAAPILKRLIGETDDTARKVIEHFGWKASVIDMYVDGPPAL